MAENESPWFKITVQHVRRVDVLETAESLVDERLEVRIAERLARADDCVQVGLHQLLVEVYLVEVAIGPEDDVHVVEACNLGTYSD
jgi:hypothetical protein